MIEDKRKAKELVLAVLQRLKLSPYVSIDKALNDSTVRAYLGVVKDKKENKYFLKVRVQDLETEKRFLQKSHFFGKFLSSYPQLSFNKKTPQLLKSSFGEDIDYLLYKFIKGEDLGTRRYYDVIRLKMNEIDEVLYILKSLLEIPAKFFPKNYEQNGTAFFKKRFKSCAALGIGKYLEKKEVGNLKKISQLSLFDEYLKFFCHGDFKPNNFIRTKEKGIFVVDFEISSISNQFYDFFSIWAYAVRKPRWQKTLMERFLRTYKFKSREEHLLFEAEKVMFLMFELGSLLWYFERNLTKSGIRVAKRYLPVRVNDLKKGLENFHYL